MIKQYGIKKEVLVGMPYKTSGELRGHFRNLMGTS
jgi:hypothetical protein